VDELAAIVDRLYGLPPEDFTAARDAAARDVDKVLKPRVKALRRPTVAAWLVNRLTRERHDLLEQLLALGPALAEAQAAGSGDQVRALSRSRRELVQAGTRTAVEDAGREITAAVRTEIEQTLEAALADPAAAEAVRTGALVRALAFAGFGGVDVEGAVAVEGAGRRSERGPRPRPDGAGKRAAAQRSTPGTRRDASRTAALRTAEQAALDTAAALDDAARACEAAEERRDRAERAQRAAKEGWEAAQAAVDDLERRLTAARQALSGSGHQVHDAQADAATASRAADRAAQRVEQAQQAAEAARRELDALRRGS
jgi:hypothetical protein